MKFRELALVAASLALAAATNVQPAVQPGGDIPPNFHPTYVPPIPPWSDQARRSTAPAGQLQYVRREAMIPMRDGVRLYAVLILPKGASTAPIMLDRTPYSADRTTSRGSSGLAPENILSPLNAELVRAGYIVAIEDVRGKYRSERDYVMNRPL